MSACGQVHPALNCGKRGMKIIRNQGKETEKVKKESRNNKKQEKTQGREKSKAVEKKETEKKK